MPSLIDIRRRIRAVKSTQQITKAMKMVAASRLRRAHERIVGARPFAQRMLRVLNSLVSRIDQDTQNAHPLLRLPDEAAGRTLLIVITADRGLCGSFNSNVVKAAGAFIVNTGGPGREIALGLVGRKGRDFFRRRGFAVRYEQVNLFHKLTYGDAQAIARAAIDEFVSGEVSSVYLVYNEFKSVIAQRVVVERLLPIPRGAFSPAPSAHARGASERGHRGEGVPGLNEASARSADGLAEGRGAPLPASTGESGQAAETGPLVDYLYEPAPEEIFRDLLPRHVEIQVYRALLESAAAEHAARMTAMDAATRNSAEMIDSLTLYMNKVRQAAITREIIEVVSGATAT